VSHLEDRGCSAPCASTTFIIMLFTFFDVRQFAFNGVLFSREKNVFS
jgi:hypothetical protein